MPRLSADALFRLAINPAVQDRLALVEAYGGKGDIADEAAADALRIKALGKKRVLKLSPEELETARLAFVFAEQWEQGLADSYPSSPEKRKYEFSAQRFREFRVQMWGKTKLEAMTEGATSVDIVKFLDESRAVPTQYIVPKGT
ncbi:hypothetical protein P3T23_009197 [Paraburkholderia sp. GAS448]|uniref:hypothetical protein n=1 Tax=Paraburkholderia sp. GAS448 TaxID=3035136 RepID=UPI003D1C7EE3